MNSNTWDARDEIAYPFRTSTVAPLKFKNEWMISSHALLPTLYCGASDMGLSASVPLPIVMGIFVLLGFQSS